MPKIQGAKTSYFYAYKNISALTKTLLTRILTSSLSDILTDHASCVLSRCSPNYTNKAYTCRYKVANAVENFARKLKREWFGIKERKTQWYFLLTFHTHNHLNFVVYGTGLRIIYDVNITTTLSSLLKKFHAESSKQKRSG